MRPDWGKGGIGGESPVSQPESGEPHWDLGQSLLVPAELFRQWGKNGSEQKGVAVKGEPGHECESGPAAATPGCATCKDVGPFVVKVCVH